MKSLFVFTSTALCTAATMITWSAAVATDPGTAPPVATAKPVALVNGCEVSGTLERREDGLYAVLTARNPTQASTDCDVHFLVSRTPGASPYSRMMVLPTRYDPQAWRESLAAGEEKRLERRIDLPAGTPLPPLPPATPLDLQALATLSNGPALPSDSGSNTIRLAVPPDTWTLTLATDAKALTGLPGLPANAFVALQQGEVAIAQINN